MKIRRATITDLERIVNFIYPDYFNESIYSKRATYSEKNTREYVSIWLTSMCTMLLEAEDELIGIAVCGAFKTFYEEAEGDIEFFYINPKYRGTGAARLLRDAVTDFAKMMGADIIYACGGSGIDEKNDSLWRNLFKRAGYISIGSTMAWFKNG